MLIIHTITRCQWVLDRVRIASVDSLGCPERPGGEQRGEQLKWSCDIRCGVLASLNPAARTSVLLFHDSITNTGRRPHSIHNLTTASP